MPGNNNIDSNNKEKKKKQIRKKWCDFAFSTTCKTSRTKLKKKQQQQLLQQMAAFSAGPMFKFDVEFGKNHNSSIYI